MNGRVLALVAHFDRQNKVDPYFLFLVRQLQEVAGEILVVSASDIPLDALDLLGAGVRLLKRDNIGYDFGSWKEGLNEVGDLSGYGLLILANDSVYAGRHCFSNLFEIMADEDCDVWGVTESLELDRHLQSYFLVFKPAFFSSEYFARFWSQLSYSQDKDDVILKGEIDLTRTIEQAGFRIATVFHPSVIERIQAAWRTSKKAATARSEDAKLPRLAYSFRALREFVSRFRRLRTFGFNPTLALWDRLILRGARFVKIELLRSNPLSVSLSPARRILSRAELPIKAIQAHLDRIYQTKID